MKKIKKIIGAVPGQNSRQTAKQTNVQTYIGYFIGPSIRGSNKISSHILAKCFMFIESWIQKNSEQAEKRTNVQRVFHRTFTSWIQNINTQNVPYVYRTTDYWNGSIKNVHGLLKIFIISICDSNVFETIAFVLCYWLCWYQQATYLSKLIMIILKSLFISF